MENGKKAVSNKQRGRSAKYKSASLDEFPDNAILLAADRAGTEGNQEAMDTMGYVLVAKEGNLVRIDKDGTNTIIRPLVWNQNKRA